MNEKKDQAEGMKDKLVGNIKEGFGNLSNDQNLRQEGQDQQFKGGLKDTLGRAKEKLSDAAHRVEEKIRKTGS